MPAVPPVTSATRESPLERSFMIKVLQASAQCRADSEPRFAQSAPDLFGHRQLLRGDVVRCLGHGLLLTKARGAHVLIIRGSADGGLTCIKPARAGTAHTGRHHPSETAMSAIYQRILVPVDGSATSDCG